MNTLSLITIISIFFQALSSESIQKNTKIITTAEELDLGVNKCYTCQENCTGPLQEQNCTDLHELIGYQVKAACLTYEQTLDDGTIEISRGCVHDEASMSDTCATTNLLPSIKCSICREELCNQRAEDKGVKECYFCDGTCAEPMEKQNCFDELGAVEAECQNAIRADGKIIRRCVRANDWLIGIACLGINTGGGNCTMCKTDLCNDYGEVTITSTTSTTTTDLPTTSTGSSSTDTTEFPSSTGSGTPSESTPGENSTTPSGSNEETSEEGDDDSSESFRVSIFLVFALLMFTLNCY